MYKNILVDMGNVIMDFSPDYVIAQYTDDVKKINRLKNAIFFNEMWNKLDQAVVSKQQVYDDAIKHLEKQDYEIAKEIIYGWYKYKTVNLKMCDILKELKNKGYKLYLCSNAAESFYDYCDSIEIFKIFDGKIISADIKLIKPNKEYFEYVLNKHNLKPEECLFVDDSINNIKGAYSLGIDGYWYNGNAQLFYEYLLKTNIL